MSTSPAFSLFDMLDNISITTADILNSADRTACDLIFSNYTELAQHLVKLYELIEPYRKLHKYMDYQERPASVFYSDKENLHTKLTELFEVSEGCNKELIEKIENHFQQKYNLTFKSYAPAKPKYRYEKEETPEPVYTSYDEIIKAMTNQIGTDFTQVAFKQNASNFAGCFYSKRDTPTINKNKITMPDFGTWYRYSSTSNKQFRHLFAVLSYFNSGSFEYTNVIQQLYNNMDNTAGEGQQVIGFEKATGITFFKNGKCIIEFTTPELAANFWNTFDFNSIIAKLTD